MCMQKIMKFRFILKGSSEYYVFLKPDSIFVITEVKINIV
jgi:hypothetical protein